MLYASIIPEYFCRCKYFGTNIAQIGSFWKQSKECIYYQVHPNPHSELDIKLLENLLPSIRGCRMQKLNTITMTVLLSQTSYKMYEK